MPVFSGLFLRYFKLLSVISVKLRLIKTFVNVVGKRCKVEYTPNRPLVTYRSERYGKPNKLKLIQVNQIFECLLNFTPLVLLTPHIFNCLNFIWKLVTAADWKSKIGFSFIWLLILILSVLYKPSFVCQADQLYKTNSNRSFCQQMKALPTENLGQGWS